MGDWTPFASSASFACATAWVDECLAAAARRRIGPLTQLRVRPWGTVLTAATDAGPVWMKATGPTARHEVALYELFARVVPERVLRPLGADTGRGWLLLPDGGPELRGGPDAFEQLTAVLPVYGRMQLDVAAYVPEMLAAGVPDMRPEAMPARFDEAVAAVAQLVERVGDAHDRAVVEQVVTLRGRFAEWCAALAAGHAPSSVDHNDLHPGNVLGGARFFDWGDAVVAHPMTSMYVPLRMAEPGRRAVVRDTYLRAFADLAPHRELVAELVLACRVAIVARTLTWVRGVGVEGTGAFWPRGPLECLAELAAPTWLPSG